MALQVRLRHALGERVLELPERGVAEPLVIGRANDVDIQIPSVSVTARHCVLFVHEGQWVVQGIDGVSKLNGQPLSGPTALSIGDRIAIGSDPSPPTLEIDPLGSAEGNSGAAQARVLEASAPPSIHAANWVGGVPAPDARGAVPPQPVYAAPPPQVHRFVPPEAQEVPSDQIDWTPATPSTRAGNINYYIPRRRNSSGAATAIAVVLGLLTLAGAALYAYRHTRQLAPPPPPPPVVQTQPAPIEDDTPAFRSKLFDMGGNRQQPRSTDGVPAPVSTPPAGGGAASGGGSPPLTTETSDAPEPRRPANADATWEDVQSRHYEVERQGPAIIAFDEYRRLHPGQFDKELDRYTDDAVNWIWWQRVNQLWNQRDRLAETIRKKKQDIRAQPTGSFHDKLVTEQADLEAQYAKVQQTLTVDMGYSYDKPPDVKNPAALKELSRTRDPAKYAVFKKRVLNYVRIHHGDLPWAGEG